MTTTSPHPGMGANLVEGGCSFRVWAPFATGVSVVGTFSEWSPKQLASEGNGYWSGVIQGAAYRDEYKYVLQGEHEVLWKNDPYAREMTHSNGNSVIIDPSYPWPDEKQYSMPPWNELVIYEMHVGTFNDSKGGPPGNFETAIGRLDYLANDLGVNAIHIMPPYEFAGAFSWGYNPSHIFAIERDYGGPKAFRRFIEAAHAKGLAVIFDVVYNHFGPSDLDLWRFDGWHDPGHDGGIYFYDNDRSRTPWGHTRPDYGRGEVRQMIRDNVLFWLEEFHVDGLRMDATAYIRSVDGNGHDLPDGWTLMQWLNNEVNARQPWKVMIAEDLRNNAWITKPTSEGGAGFDTQWDARFVHPVREAIIVQHDHDRSMHAVAAALAHRYNVDAIQRLIYTESHDEVANGKSRVPEEIWPGHADSWFSKKRSTLGAALVMTSPGIPMIFQGQEFLEDRWFHDDDPLDWQRRERFSGIVALYRDLIRLRRNWYDNTRGLRGPHVNVFHINDQDKVIAFHRWAEGGPGDDVVVVANFSSRGFTNYRLGLPRGGDWRLRLSTDANVYDSSFGSLHAHDCFAWEEAREGLRYSASASLPPYTALIYSQ